MKLFCIFSLWLMIKCNGEEISVEEDEVKGSLGVANIIHCPAEELVDVDKNNEIRYGKFEFPRTRATGSGNERRVPCPYGFRNDGFEPFIEPITTTTAAETKAAISGVTRKCYLLKEEVDNETISRGVWIPSLEYSRIEYCKKEGWKDTLDNWLNTLKTITAATYFQLNRVMVRLFLYAEDDIDCAAALINGIAELLTSPRLNGGENGTGMSISQEARNHLFNETQRYSDIISAKLPAGRKFQVGDAGILVETAKFYARNKYQINQFFEIKPYATLLETSDDTSVTVDIPAEAIGMAMAQDKVEPQLKITAYSHDVFKRWGPTSDVVTEHGACLPTLPTAYQNTSLGCEFSDDGCENIEPPYTNWGLLCIELNGEIKGLKEPLEFFVSQNSSNTLEGYQLVCVFWDDQADMWSTEGVVTTPLDGGIKCSSSHLTAFSALIEPLPLPGSGSGSGSGSGYAPVNNTVHKFILEILSSIGSVCSIVGLGLTLFTYAMFSSLRKERSNRILINLCSSLLLLHIMTLSGSKSLWDGKCFVPALSMHYLVLTSLGWMMVEAIHMFDLLISVFVRPERRFLIKRFVLAWGIPLIICGICAAVHPDVYKKGRLDLCLMNAENPYLYYGAFITPVCIMLLANLFIFLRVFRVLYQQTKRTNKMSGSSGKLDQNWKLGSKFIKISPLQIKGASAVFFLLGIGWIFGLLAIGPFEVFFRYVYVVVNAGQGLFIFLFRVVLNPHASKHWKKVILGLSPESSSDTSYTTSSTASGNGKRRKRRSTSISPTFISASNSVENSLTPSNPLSKSLALTLASILQSERERAEGGETKQIE